MSNPASPSSPQTAASPPSDPSPVAAESPSAAQSSPPLALLPPPTSSAADSAPSEAAAVASGVATPSVNPRRPPPPCWSQEETTALIEAYREQWYALRRGSLKASHWQEVADAVGRRCPGVTPAKTAVQCRHKMEKLRKRYRAEIKRARSMPVSRFSSSWVHFKQMDAMEKGPSSKSRYKSDGSDDDNDDDDEDDLDLYGNDTYRNGGVTAKSATRRSFEPNGIGGTTGGGSSSSGGFRIRIPTGVSVAQPGPKFSAKMDHKYAAKPNYTASPNAYATPKEGYGSGSSFSARVPRGVESGVGRRERERERDGGEGGDVVSEMAAAIRLLGDGFVRMEQMKMEMAREMEVMRMEMEIKRTDMILESQQRIVEAFAKAFADGKNKRPKRSPES